MNSELIPIKDFSFRFEAERAQGALEAAGIPSFLRGDDASGWAPHIGFATGGLTLFIDQAHIERARRILDDENGND